MLDFALAYLICDVIRLTFRDIPPHLPRPFHPTERYSWVEKAGEMALSTNCEMAQLLKGTEIFLDFALAHLISDVIRLS